LLNKAIAVAWRDGPPVPRDRQEEEGWEELLAQLGPVPALEATIRAWPIRGPLARQVLLTHELAGDQAPLDAYLRRVLDGVITKEDEEIAKGGDPSTDLAIAMSRPNLVRVRMLTEIIKKGAASSLFTALVKEVVQTSEYMEKSKLVRKLFSRSREITPHTAHALFLWTLLDDQRLASPPLVTEVLRLTDLDKTTLASDLRVCDVVMARLGNQTISGESVNEDAKERAFHLSLTRGDRDTLIAKRRAVIQTMADSIAIELGLNAEDLHRLGMKEQASNF
jgi:hypothetical protein